MKPAFFLFRYKLVYILAKTAFGNRKRAHREIYFIVSCSLLTHEQQVHHCCLSIGECRIV
uniref:Putative salivary secreted peptide n=1 Tax=Ixodes pacificus TaxID=29930 RepID=Q6B8A1_IXOPA|nr:putative salivary secreted peptide [Ixodes pacificus]